MIATWWAGLSLGMKILWGITLTASLIFIVQTILTFIGADTGGDLEMDVDIDSSFEDPSGFDGHTGMNLYTFRNFVNFCLGFGWSAILLENRVGSTVLRFILAIIIGVGLVALVMYLFKWLATMQQSGNIDVYKSAVGCKGKVYLTIPAERSGEGKVQITINNAVREYTAVTDGDAIPTATPITVIEVLNASTLVVEPLNSLII